MTMYDDDLHKGIVLSAKKWVTDAFGIAKFEDEFAKMFYRAF